MCCNLVIMNQLKASALTCHSRLQMREFGQFQIVLLPDGNYKSARTLSCMYCIVVTSAILRLLIYEAGWVWNLDPLPPRQLRGGGGIES